MTTNHTPMHQVLTKALVFEGAPLRLQRKPEYIASKAEERKNKPAEPTTPAPPAPQPKAAAEKEERKKEEARDVSVPEGAHLRVTFAPDADLNDVTWRGVSELLGGRDAGIRHVSFKQVGGVGGGDPATFLQQQADMPANEALVRFNTAAQAAEALVVTEDGTIKVAGVPATVTPVTGEEDAALRAKVCIFSRLVDTSTIVATHSWKSCFATQMPSSAAGRGAAGRGAAGLGAGVDGVASAAGTIRGILEHGCLHCIQLHRCMYLHATCVC